MPETRRRDNKREQPIETVEIPREQTEVPVEPRVSVIIVSRNQVTALRRAVEALEKSQNRDRIEIIIIDCASQDDSRYLDTEYEHITVLRLPHNMGATRAMNIGTRTSKADLVFFLSPDVEVAPETVTQLADRLENASDTTAAAPLLVDAEGNVASRDQKIDDVLSGKPGEIITDAGESVAVEYAPRTALLVRKPFIKGMNYFDERYGHFGADLDLAAQIENAQRKIRVYPGIRAVIRPSEDPNASDTLFKPDRIIGTAVWRGKYVGFFSGLTFRIGAIFSALAGFRVGELIALVGGQKLDGSQSM